MIFKTAGAKIYIGALQPQVSASKEFTATDFDGETWTEITGSESLGSLGGTSAEITFGGIDALRTQRLKGLRSPVTMEAVWAINYADAGQQALIAAEKVDGDYSFRVVFNDAPVNGTPSERMFVAAVGALTEAYDSADSLMKLNASLWVNSNVVRVNAAPGV